MKLFIYLFLLPLTSFSKDASYAYFPYLNYDTTQSWSYGLALEKESENRKIDTYLIDAELTRTAQLRLATNYQTHFNQDWGIGLRNDFTSFYDPFYGFGISTKPEDVRKIKRRELHFQTLIFYHFSDFISAGPLIEFRHRKEKPDYQFDKKRFFPDEDSISFGGNFLYDSRDSITNPSHGEKHELQFMIVPDGINHQENKSTFSRVKMDLRKYMTVTETVLVTRFAVGTTIGDPSYSYKYHLGGGNFLRGYETNRFIGDQFMSTQIEDRIDLYKKYISATVSYELGSVTPNLIDKRRSSYGVGLRLAMPPDWSNMLTLNLGFGDDQKNIVMDFNENF